MVKIEKISLLTKKSIADLILKHISEDMILVSFQNKNTDFSEKDDTFAKNLLKTMQGISDQRFFEILSDFCSPLNFPSKKVSDKNRLFFLGELSDILYVQNIWIDTNQYGEVVFRPLGVETLSLAEDILIKGNEDSTIIERIILDGKNSKTVLEYVADVKNDILLQYYKTLDTDKKYTYQVGPDLESLEKQLLNEIEDYTSLDFWYDYATDDVKNRTKKEALESLEKDKFIYELSYNKAEREYTDNEYKGPVIMASFNISADCISEKGNTNEYQGYKVEIIDKIGYIIYKGKKYNLGKSDSVPYRLLRCLYPIGASIPVTRLYNETNKKTLSTVDSEKMATKLSSRLKDTNRLLKKNRIKLKLALKYTGESIQEQMVHLVEK